MYQSSTAPALFRAHFSKAGNLLRDANIADAIARSVRNHGYSMVLKHHCAAPSDAEVADLYAANRLHIYDANGVEVCLVKLSASTLTLTILEEPSLHQFFLELKFSSEEFGFQFIYDSNTFLGRRE